MKKFNILVNLKKETEIIYFDKQEFIRLYHEYKTFKKFTKVLQQILNPDENKIIIEGIRTSFSEIMRSNPTRIIKKVFKFNNKRFQD